MSKTFFDYSKLKGRIVEVFGSQKAFTKAFGVTESTLSQKLNGRTYFMQTEIFKIAKLLQISPEDISAYFFTQRVQ